jgi:uncharacterized membrane protein YgdD (TMEM256/DUF423 family)
MRTWLLVGAVNGFLAVAAGAFAAHGLEARVDARSLGIFQTGAHYHLTHALAIMAASFAARDGGGKPATVAAWLFTVGILLFSGSLYFMVLAGSNALVLATPLGGVLLLAGWVALAFAALK